MNTTLLNISYQFFDKPWSQLTSTQRSIVRDEYNNTWNTYKLNTNYNR
jgi:hypothetical protein